MFLARIVERDASSRNMALNSLTNKLLLVCRIKKYTDQVQACTIELFGIAVNQAENSRYSYKYRPYRLFSIGKIALTEAVNCEGSNEAFSANISEYHLSTENVQNMKKGASFSDAAV